MPIFKLMVFFLKAVALLTGATVLAAAGFIRKTHSVVEYLSDALVLTSLYCANYFVANAFVGAVFDEQNLNSSWVDGAYRLLSKQKSCPCVLLERNSS